MIKCLENHGTLVGAKKDRFGWTVLHYAVENGHLPVLFVKLNC
ncbi:MAG: ankyrin repeat domain-containing protein [Oligoflexales bacterium]|nr:ankyrin repeat domain-containing protein [Oligoflexales bacterium]